MNQNILDHYLEFSSYTFPGGYLENLRKELPDDIRELGLLVRKSVIHRTTLEAGNTGTNMDLRFGDMTEVPWWRQPEDDILVTASAMLAELYRRDSRGFVVDRRAKDKIIVTCRHVAVLVASILKSKGIPTRVRSGNASYFDGGELGKVSFDHWLNQYWDKDSERWVTIDVDGSLSLSEDFDPYDVPLGKFDFAAESWLAARAGKIDAQYFYNAKPERGLIVVLWSLFYDFHSLMNNEIPYAYGPACGYGSNERFNKLTPVEFERIDNLARLMQEPDGNFDELMKIWENQKDFRLLIGGVL